MVSIFIYILIILPFFVIGGGIHNQHAGHEFDDIITEFDDSIWIQKNGSFHCSASARLLACAIDSSKNLAYIDNHHPIFDFQPRLLQIWLRNDCYQGLSASERSKCCAHGSNRKCTSFTTGRLKSRHTYGHGIFLFHAIAGPNRGDANVPMEACFSLREAEHHNPDTLPMEISMCFTSTNPWRMKILWQYGDTRMSQYVPLTYDASQTPENYGIVWKPGGVDWIINEALVAELTANRPIPDLERLHIRISLLPLPSDVGYPANSVASKIDVYRVGYKKLTTTQPPLHDELFVIGDKKHTSLVPLITLGLVMIVISIFLCRHFRGFQRSNTPHGYAVLPSRQGSEDLSENWKFSRDIIPVVNHDGKG